MIILSLSERTTLAVEEQLSENCAYLIEVRLDALETISIKDIQRLLKKRPMLVTLRSKDEGGEREYSLAKRHQILKEVIDLKPQYLDLEYARDQRLIAYVKETSPCGREADSNEKLFCLEIQNCHSLRVYIRCFKNVAADKKTPEFYRDFNGRERGAHAAFRASLQPTFYLCLNG